MSIGKRPVKPSVMCGDQDGFTLVELMLVIALMLSILTLSAPLFRNAYADLEVKNAVFNIKQVIRYASTKSVLTRKPLKVHFDFDRGTYRLFENAKADQFRPVQGRLGRTVMLPAAIHMNGSKPDITFYADGSCDEAEFDLVDNNGHHLHVNIHGFDCSVEANTV